MKNWKKALRFALILLPIAAAGGLFTGIYTFEAYTEETRAALLAQMPYGVMLLSAALQSALYGLVCGFFGYLLADKTGLLRPFRFRKGPTLRAAAATLVCGALFTLDYFVFAPLIPQVAESYAAGISPAYFLSALLYGGIIEEVLMRLFLMSLLALVLWKLFARRAAAADIPTWVFVAANVLAAALFAAGHLPATVSLFGTLSPLILLRCFLLNGGLGLVFGRLYRRYGIQYAMLAHLGTHLINKLILLAIL